MRQRIVKSLQPKAISEANKALTEIRETANRLLDNDTFVKWLGDVMTRNGYFDNREKTSYQQGVRNGIAREAERLFEAADDGDKKFAEIFMENILKYNKQTKEK